MCPASEGMFDGLSPNRSGAARLGHVQVSVRKSPFGALGNAGDSGAGSAWLAIARTAPLLERKTQQHGRALEPMSARALATSAGLPVRRSGLDRVPIRPPARPGRRRARHRSPSARRRSLRRDRLDPDRAYCARRLPGTPRPPATRKPLGTTLPTAGVPLEPDLPGTETTISVIAVAAETGETSVPAE